MNLSVSDLYYLLNITIMIKKYFDMYKILLFLKKYRYKINFIILKVIL